MQSNEQHLPSWGKRLMPSETPSLRLWMGPNIGESYNTVIVFQILGANLHLISIINNNLASKVKVFPKKFGGMK
jgi:hypothetical protein